jgi:uncharacterized protein YggU (UPF0235/DUF167 family)
MNVVVRVKPGASRTRVGGSHPGPYGPALIIAVNAPAVDGRATDATRKALAAALGVHARDVSLKTGATSRDKIFTVDDPPADLAERVSRLRDSTS